ncbi:hypothetical protein Ddye_014012 [Dipteronia dyeriana]|uniref:Uncharacterized protein n=1 Tax=Dipteronia dyeriana TaxID=168575 RepID=A0AAD9X7N1_9ROSI|nr:hypothetical protein Ddye_014012 [Dipteronia dyeriana]
MHSVKSVGDEFVGQESDNISSFSSSSLLIAFPKLHSLKFYYLSDWEEWDCGASGRGEEQIKIMPCLRSLIIYGCPKLKTLPDYLLQSTTLEEFGIIHGPILERRYRVEKAENWVKGSGIPKIRIYENSMYLMIWRAPHHQLSPYMTMWRIKLKLLTSTIHRYPSLSICNYLFIKFSGKWIDIVTTRMLSLNCPEELRDIIVPPFSQLKLIEAGCEEKYATTTTRQIKLESKRLLFQKNGKRSN